MPPPRSGCLFSPSRSSGSITSMNEKASVLRPLPRWRGRCIRSTPESSIMYPDARIRSQHFLVSRHYILPSGPWAKKRLGSFTPSRSEEHTSELQSHHDLVCRLLLEKKKIY